MSKQKSLLIGLKYRSKILDTSFPIVIDDIILIIKEKIFAMNYKFHPSLLKLENNKSEKTLISYTNLEINIIYVIDYLKSKSEYIYDTDIDNLLLELKNEGFLDLTKDSLLYSIKMISEELEVPLLYNEQIDMNNDVLKNESKQLYEKYIKIYDNSIIKKFYEIGKNFDSSFIKDPVYNDIKLIIKGDNIESGVNGNFIKLQEIFNNIELSNNIPVVVLNKKVSSQQYNAPLIKIYDKLLEENEGTLKEEEIKKWIINEKKYDNQSSFKIIKGLLLKLKIKISNIFSYLTINILSNGIILVNFSESQFINISIQDLLLLIYSNVNNLINKLNSLNGVFLRSKHLSLIDINEDKSIVPKNVHIISLDTTTDINKSFDKFKFSSLINNLFISDNIITGKHTKSENVSSLLYTKINRINTEKLGITINISHTEFNETDSTTVKISGAENYNQTYIILYIINILLDLQKSKKDSFFTSNTVKKKIKTTKKKAKELNVNYDSKKCQSGRQPIVDLDNYTPIYKKTEQKIPLPNNLPALKSYVLNYKNKQFKCNDNLSSKLQSTSNLKESELNKLLKSPGDIYPGFTVDGIVCCFSKNQESDETFIKHINPESLYITIKPSNYLIKINSNYSTFALYIPPPNNNSGYYYLNQETPVKLVKITDKNLILKLKNKEEDGKRIWLDEITLSKIIYPSIKEECNIQPNLNNTLSPCKHHKDYPYFGYSAKSLPCCFDSERSPFITKQKKSNNNLKTNYIITNPNRVLSKEDQRGLLPNNINSILTFYYPNSNFYRLGFNQHPASFINATLLGINNTKIKNYGNFNNHIDLKKNIIKYLSNEKFKQLNNGDLLLKYKSLDIFLNKFNNDLLSENELIDLLEQFLKFNIIILDNTNSDKNIKISCRNSIKFNNYNKTILLFKHKSLEYELIISIPKNKDLQENNTVDEPNKKNHINYSFDSQSKNHINYSFDSQSLLIEFFIKYLEKSCIIQNNYPENWKFIDLLDATTILETKLQGKWKIKYQLVNTFNKVNLLVTENNFFIPISESGILSDGDKILSQKQLNYYIDNPTKLNKSDSDSDSDSLLTLNDYKIYLKEFNKIFSQNCKIESIVDSKHKKIGGIITSYGYIVPYLKEENQDDKMFKKESFYYYPEIDYVLNDIQDSSYININSNYENYKFLQYNLKNNIYNVKVILGKLIKTSPDSQLRDYIYETIKSPEIPRIRKINIILDIFNQFRDFWNSLIHSNLLSMLFTNDNIYIINLSKSKINFIFHYIIQEMLDDNIENLLLNNIITSDTIKQNEIIKRDNESLLIGIADIRQWLITHKKQPLIQEQLHYPSNFASI
jgi:hypothetical protein